MSTCSGIQKNSIVTGEKYIEVVQKSKISTRSNAKKIAVFDYYSESAAVARPIGFKALHAGLGKALFGKRLAAPEPAAPGQSVARGASLAPPRRRIV